MTRLSLWQVIYTVEKKTLMYLIFYLFICIISGCQWSDEIYPANMTMSAQAKETDSNMEGTKKLPAPKVAPTRPTERPPLPPKANNNIQSKSAETSPDKQSVTVASSSKSANSSPVAPVLGPTKVTATLGRTPEIQRSQSINHDINDISSKVIKFENIGSKDSLNTQDHSSHASTENLHSQLWFYKDGLRSPSVDNKLERSPSLDRETVRKVGPRVARSRSLSANHSQGSRVKVVKVSSSEVPSLKPMIVTRNGATHPIRPPRTRSKTPPTPPPRSNSPSMKKAMEMIHDASKAITGEPSNIDTKNEDKVIDAMADSVKKAWNQDKSGPEKAVESSITSGLVNSDRKFLSSPDVNKCGASEVKSELSVPDYSSLRHKLSLRSKRESNGGLSENQRKTKEAKMNWLQNGPPKQHPIKSEFIENLIKSVTNVEQVKQDLEPLQVEKVFIDQEDDTESTASSHVETSLAQSLLEEELELQDNSNFQFDQQNEVRIFIFRIALV